ncbi:MAG TPA: DUF3343 domain-containing protein [Candidatus Limnocylindrales bacterium]|nr:DUF3343 domain-containing protein [Candidatus Limnocylindrales bacterium]
MITNCYITFSSTYFAIRAESLLTELPLSFKMLPVPRSISSGCGVALRCNCEDLPVLRNHLLINNLELEGFYRVEEKGLQRPVVSRLHFDQ